MGPPLRLVIVAVVLMIVGGVIFLRALWRLAAAVRSRFTRGAPYHAGQSADRLFGLVMTLPVLPAGCLLLWLALAQAAFQPTSPGGHVRVGRLEARRAGWGRTAVRLDPDPGYPERRLLEGEVDGARWAVAGDFLDWAPGVRWLGLQPAHRVRVLLGTGDPSGTGPGQHVAAIDAPPAAARYLLDHARWVPFVTIRRNASSWIAPADRTIAVLYATPAGYFTDTAAVDEAR